jgi:hypothetical protein
MVEQGSVSVGDWMRRRWGEIGQVTSQEQFSVDWRRSGRWRAACGRRVEGKENHNASRRQLGPERRPERMPSTIGWARPGGSPIFTRMAFQTSELNIDNTWTSLPLVLNILLGLRSIASAHAKWSKSI